MNHIMNNESPKIYFLGRPPYLSLLSAGGSTDSKISALLCKKGEEMIPTISKVERSNPQGGKPPHMSKTNAPVQKRRVDLVEAQFSSRVRKERGEWARKLKEVSDGQ
jgi:hypothetical protein